MSKLMLFSFVALLMLGSAARSQELQPVGPKLTPKLLDLLRQEMQAVLQASHEIVQAAAFGEHSTVAEKARQVHDSFILEQSMSEQERKDLIAAVPQEFVNLDRSFHELTGNLAKAARARNQSLIDRYVGEMIAACGGCHSKYATDRFPGFQRN